MLHGLLFLLPALALFASMALGYHPGEARLERLAASRKPRRRRVRATALALPRAAPRRLLRGGLLLARSMAKRPPPHTPAYA